MMSVRVTAAGAMIVLSLAYFTAPVSACDERYAKKCENAAEAASAGGQAESAPAKRRIVRHVRLVTVTGGKRTRAVTRQHAPGFAVKRDRGMSLASDSSRSVTLAPESTVARRFRGFIDPQPISDNPFEALRKPHLVALNMEPAAALPAAPIAVPESAEAASSAADSTASAATAAKQVRIAPVAGAGQAPTVTRQVALTDALAAKPVAQAESVASPGLAAPQQASAGQGPSAPQAMPQAVLTEAPPAKPADEPGRFPVHKLVLALCGALGAASALRFIVRA
ncbi:MAG: hypothetical protein V7608_3406 [Hyphomicrobiales bacterium]